MPFHFIRVSACSLPQSEEELNRFLRSHRVVSIEKQWIACGENSYWLFNIEYLDSPTKPEAEPKPTAESGKTDYRQVFDDDDFAVYSELRALRKEISLAESTPVYMVFTNDQLAAMVQQRVITKDALKKVDKVGQTRLDKYGDRFLAILQSHFKDGESEAKA